MAQMTTAEVAEELGTDTRTLRKFLRFDAKKNEAETPGKGGRYAIEKKDLRGLKSRFAAWKSSSESKPSKKVEVAETIDDEIDDAEPTGADLEEIEDELELD